MMIQSSRRNILINKDEIINYQFQILDQSTPLAKPTISNSNKYSLWDLDAKVREAVGDNPYSVRWIGNCQTAYLQTYAYIMLIAASHSEANIIQFKHTIYKLGRQCLNLPQQKLLVQFLCLIQYSRDRYAFLNKYPQIQAILIKILQYVEEDSPPSEDSAQQIKKKAKVRRKTSARALSKSCEKKEPNNATHRSKNSESQQTQYEKELQQIYSGFNKHFQFISMLGSNEYSCSLKLFQTKKIYVIIQKDCYFMVQLAEKSQKTYLQFTLGNKYLSQNGKNDFQQQIRTQIKAFGQKYFKNQEDAMVEYQNEVQQSKVISIQRASQIRNPLSNRFGFADSKKSEFAPNHSQHRQSQNTSFDKTFIDELITNTEKDVTRLLEVGNQSKVPAHTLTKKQQIMQKMKQFKKMKQAIQQVRERIQEKLKRIDEVEHFKSEIASKNLQKKQSQHTQQSIPQNNQHISQLYSQREPKIKLDPTAYRKGSLNIPISLQSISQPKNLQEQIMHHKSQYNIPRNLSMKNGKYLSQKAYSRPDSKVKSPQESLQKAYSPKLKPMMPNNRKGSLDVALIQPVSPNNVNVNVNVSINETLLNPRYTSPTSSYLKQHLQKYATSIPKNQNQWPNVNYKWPPNQQNYFHYHTGNQDINPKMINVPWNIAKPNNLFSRK